jgi:hypothetical protein
MILARYHGKVISKENIDNVFTIGKAHNLRHYLPHAMFL